MLGLTPNLGLRRWLLPRGVAITETTHRVSSNCFAQVRTTCGYHPVRKQHPISKCTLVFIQVGKPRIALRRYRLPIPVATILWFSAFISVYSVVFRNAGRTTCGYHPVRKQHPISKCTLVFIQVGKPRIVLRRYGLSIPVATILWFSAFISVSSVVFQNAGTNHLRLPPRAKATPLNWV
jgi:hypothetical protein